MVTHYKGQLVRAYTGPDIKDKIDKLPTEGVKPLRLILPEGSFMWETYKGFDIRKREEDGKGIYETAYEVQK